ncbi:MAG: ATP-binding protein [Nitrospiraceae bacterium]|nr:ATP-binding protein [Nitrospiraceae bacterium]
MFKEWLLVSVVLAYLCLLFLIAYLAEKREKMGRSIVSNPYIYSLSLAVFCSSWTFYGSVGRAASSGLSFLTIYLGPTLMMALSPILLRKVIRISKENRITSISDFLGARYGNSLSVSALAAFIALVGIAPYLGLQLKAIMETFSILAGQREGSSLAGWVITLALGVFAIIFGARKLDSSERHEGLVFAVAFESIIKLAAFLGVGIYVSFFLFGGVSEIFQKIEASSRFSSLVSLGNGGQGGYGQWASLLVLSMSAVFFLPRQFQVSVVENSDDSHLSKAVWLFPLYLLLMNLFVMPIAFGGLLVSGGNSAGADNFVLTIPLGQGSKYLALFAFIGGFSAATGMVIVGSVAISTMVMNNLVMPAVYKLDRLKRVFSFPLVILNLKRLVILGFVFLGYAFAVHVGEYYSLVDIGLQSFEAVTIFAPAFLIGLYWKRGNRKGALAGMSTGFIVWAYTLLLPSLVKAGVIHDSGLLLRIIHSGLLNPEALFGTRGLDKWTNSLLWELLFNTFFYVSLSLATSPDENDEKQAFLFVESCPAKLLPALGNYGFEDLQNMLGQYIGREEAIEALDSFMRANKMSQERLGSFELIRLREEAKRVLSGTMGSAIASMIIERRVAGTEEEKSEVLQSIRQITRTLRLSRSELEEANSELCMLKEFSENILESLPLGVATLDGSLRVKYWNRAMEKITGTPKTEVMEKEASRILTCIGQDIFNMANAGKEIVCRTGEKTLNGYCSALKGGQAGYVAVFEDITEKKRIEEELFRATKHASLGRLAAGVSHEIGNPLASISSLVQELIEEDLSTAQGAAFAKDSMATINRHIERIARIVRSLGDFARIYPRQKTTTDIREILENTLALIRYDKGFRNIELDLKIDELPALTLDPDQMQQVFLNLILNARDAMPRGGRLEIRIGVLDGHVQMSFSDTGEGMDETLREKVFEPFFTTKSTAAGFLFFPGEREPGSAGGHPSGERGGTGLGLSICYSIIKDHGGSIEVESAKGEGTRFIIKIPVGQ